MTTETATFLLRFQAYVYPAEMRATRDLLRRRLHLTRKRAELLAHIQNTNSQYNLPEIGKKIGSVAKLAFGGQIQKSGIRKSMTCESQLSCFR